MNGIDAFEHPVLGSVAVLCGLFACWASIRTQPDALAWPAFGELRNAGARALEPVRGVALALRAAKVLTVRAAYPASVHISWIGPGSPIEPTVIVVAGVCRRWAAVSKWFPLGPIHHPIAGDVGLMGSARKVPRQASQRSNRRQR